MVSVRRHYSMCVSFYLLCELRVIYEFSEEKKRVNKTSIFETVYKQVNLN